MKKRIVGVMILAIMCAPIVGEAKGEVRVSEIPAEGLFVPSVGVTRDVCYADILQSSGRMLKEMEVEEALYREDLLDLVEYKGTERVSSGEMYRVIGRLEGLVGLSDQQVYQRLDELGYPKVLSTSKGVAQEELEVVCKVLRQRMGYSEVEIDILQMWETGLDEKEGVKEYSAVELKQAMERVYLQYPEIISQIPEIEKQGKLLRIKGLKKERETFEVYKEKVKQEIGVERKKWGENLTTEEYARLTYVWVLSKLNYAENSTTWVEGYTSGKTNCQGYVGLYKVALDAQGIPMRAKVGYTTGVEHVWSEVYVGEKCWIEVDPTWGDRGGESESRYFDMHEEVLDLKRF